MMQDKIIAAGLIAGLITLNGLAVTPHIATHGAILKYII